MINEKHIRNLVNEELLKTGGFLVEIQVKPGNRIIIEVDSDNGISIDGCARISRQVEKGLNKEEEDFELKVSSPGLDKPLRVLRQYKKNIGKQIQLVTTTGIKFKGELLRANEEMIEISDEKESGKTRPFRYEELQHTKNVISFK